MCLASVPVRGVVLMVCVLPVCGVAQLGLLHLAVPAYRRVLALGDALSQQELCAKAEYMAPGLLGDVHQDRDQPLALCYDLRREAAWNMVAILRKGGCMKMAQDLVQRYLCLD